MWHSYSVWSSTGTVHQGTHYWIRHCRFLGLAGGVHAGLARFPPDECYAGEALVGLDCVASLPPAHRPAVWLDEMLWTVTHTGFHFLGPAVRNWGCSPFLMVCPSPPPSLRAALACRGRRDPPALTAIPFKSSSGWQLSHCCRELSHCRPALYACGSVLALLDLPQTERAPSVTVTVLCLPLSQWHA